MFLQPRPRPPLVHALSRGDGAVTVIPDRILKRLCSFVQDEEVQAIGQIELCFTKDLQLRNCTEPGEPAAEPVGATPGLHVCKDGPAFYPPPPETLR